MVAPASSLTTLALATLTVLLASPAPAQSPTLVIPAAPPIAPAPEDAPAPVSETPSKPEREATYHSPTPIHLDMEEVGLMQLERDKFATFLATFVSNELGQGAADGKALAVEAAEKLIATSFMLAPRNRRAVIADYQLARGLVPNQQQADYEPTVLAELLIKRAELLREQGGQTNTAISALLSYAAVEVDPRNEDAVFLYQMFMRDGNGPDWAFYLGDRAVSPQSVPADPTPPEEPEMALPPLFQLPETSSSPQ